MKKTISLLFALLYIFGCTKTDSTAGLPKIGFVLSTLKEERYQKDKKYFEDRAKELGAEVVFDACDNDADQQVSKVENILTKGIKALVIQPVNSDAASTIVEMAHEAGVKVIAYDRIINQSDVDYYVTQNSYDVGKIQAEAAVAAIKGKGNVVILSGQAGHSVAGEITRGVLDVLKAHPDIKVVAQQNHEQWSPTKAYETTQNALTANHNKIDAILANNSGMANGAVQALEEAGFFDTKSALSKNKIFVAGADADLAAVKNIVAEKQSLEVYKDFKALAVQSADLAFKLATGALIEHNGKDFYNNGKKEVITFNTPVYKVVKENIEPVLISSGYHAKADIYGK